LQSLRPNIYFKKLVSALERQNRIQKHVIQSL